MNERSRELIGHIDVNSKVRELAEQSGCKIDRLGFGEGNLEKFAELIVRECMSMCQTAVGNADYNTGRLHCLNNIKEHFGVEE